MAFSLVLRNTSDSLDVQTASTNSLAYGDVMLAAMNIDAVLLKRANPSKTYTVTRTGSVVCPGCGATVTGIRDPAVVTCRQCAPAYPGHAGF